MLVLDALRVRYGPLEALHGVSLTFAQGEVTAVLGRNGAGKSTLLRAVAGYLRASSGRIHWQGSDITRAPVRRRADAGVMLIPDEGGVFRTLTVRENLDLFAAGRELTPALDAFPDLRTLSRRRVTLLSGGEQQMLALSRALLAPWRLLLVDELSHGLAPVLATRLYDVLAALAAAHPDRAVVLAEPDPREALALADRVHVLRRGELAATGSPADFDPATL
ncbi:ATP-binding cassette domain-containing protein [Catenulispora sp. NL8]|uniref:ATP-binding cassette domain-containing protein n=1 Tax=Catenulispora pinistramenti TaxID=2705254 RepID=A0ABS5KJZ2_9ACTN|nr:ATP-binding cassette domain-containing protein [Catenulispora pinistramenti]MBS2546340.1 ATP-binding cassette domain-containing protein [Catenulispora pinistramenti]